MSNFLQLYCPWNSPGQNTGVGSLSWFQGIFLSPGLNQVSHIAGGFFFFFLPAEPQGTSQKRKDTPNVITTWKYKKYLTSTHSWRYVKILNTYTLEREHIWNSLLSSGIWISEILLCVLFVFIFKKRSQVIFRDKVNYIHWLMQTIRDPCITLKIWFWWITLAIHWSTLWEMSWLFFSSCLLLLAEKKR